MQRAKTLMRRLIAPIAVALIVAISGTWALATPTHATIGGPVILGGDDLTDHGSKDTSTGDLVDGWLYIQRSLENIGPNVTRSNDGSIAALGSAPSTATGGGDAGAAIGFAAEKVGRTVAYYTDPTAIDGFFTALAGGTTHPAIIWISGTGAGNDLGDDPSRGLAVTAHATAIAGFVSSGGGLLSHGTDYGWLTALLPDATTVDGGSSEDLYFTPDGLTDLPGLTVANINAGPWHNHFEGDLGGLKVLVRSSSVLDSADNDAAVIIGGSRVTFVPVPTTVATNTPHACIPGLPPTYSCGGQPGGGAGSAKSATAVPVSTAPAATATKAPPPPTAVPTVAPASGVLGAIRAPNTGSGPGGDSSPMSVLLVSSVLLLAGAAALGGALRFKRG